MSLGPAPGGSTVTPNAASLAPQRVGREADAEQPERDRPVGLARQQVQRTLLAAWLDSAPARPAGRPGRQDVDDTTRRRARPGQEVSAGLSEARLAVRVAPAPMQSARIRLYLGRSRANIGRPARLGHYRVKLVTMRGCRPSHPQPRLPRHRCLIHTRPGSSFRVLRDGRRPALGACLSPVSLMEAAGPAFSPRLVPAGPAPPSSTIINSARAAPAR